MISQKHIATTHKTTFEFGGHAISTETSWHNLCPAQNGSINFYGNFATEISPFIIKCRLACFHIKQNDQCCSVFNSSVVFCGSVFLPPSGFFPLLSGLFVALIVDVVVVTVLGAAVVYDL